MDIWWLTTFVHFVCALIQVGEPSLTCLYGSDLPVPRDCTSVQECGGHEYCSLEQYITPNGFIRHKAACKDKNTCGGSTVPGTYMVVCSECCDSTLCSASGCNSAGYNSTRGPICYHCSNPVDDITHCDRIRICSADEVCAVHRNPFGHYQVGCESKTTCNTVKRIGVCSTCCTTDMCNRNCTRSSGPVMSTKPPCSDDKDCQTISSALTATGKDVCQQANLKHFCNSTCGLCPGQTTRGTTAWTSSSKPTTTMTTLPVTTAPQFCSPSPCQHGTCVPLTNTYVCICNPGYKGGTCDSTDPCYANPCVHGTCVAIPGSFHCSCHANFTGRSCDTAIVRDPCSPNPCIHGTCTTTGQTNSCACNSGYSGPTCAVLNPCFPNPCVHGTCTQIGVTFTCSCNSGYTGSTCATVDPCSSNPCTHGICSSTPGGYKCACPASYTGNTCATAIVHNPCSPNPCVHGSCTAAGTSYTCKCNSGYIGQTCNMIDPCTIVPCVHGTCTTTSTGGYHCACQAGYTGAACNTDIDECQSSPCVHGRCLDKINGYTCSCFQGYTGQQCSTDIDNCSPVNPCIHGVCHDQVNAFQCTCSSGYSGTLCDKLDKLRDCKDIQDAGHLHGHIHHRHGVYTIDIANAKTSVKCDMTKDGGGWTEIMFRHDGSVDFLHKDSTDYAVGFGDKNHNFWQGLEDIHALTSDGRRYQLRIDMTAANGTRYYEIYDDFRIGSAKDFQLHIGNHSGTAGDSLSGHNGFGFTTSDHDVDSNNHAVMGNCAIYLSGAWWFHDCYDSCLTCPYVHAAPGTSACSSMSWNSIRYCEPLRSAKMMFRPV